MRRTLGKNHGQPSNPGELWSMHPVLEEILRSGYTTSPNGELVEVRDAISREEAEFLQELISELRPQVSLEVGLAHGVSALSICDARERTPNTRHIIIDPYQKRYDNISHHHLRQDGYKGIGLHNLYRAGYEGMIEFFDLPSHQVLPQLEAQGRKIDFAFVDGWHTFDYAMIDFFYIHKMLRVGGIVVLDDADWPSIRKLCRYIVKNLSYSVRCMRQAESSRSSMKLLILNGLLRVPGIGTTLRQILKPELAESDLKLGLRGSSIAFRKESEDTRRWDFHGQF